MKIHLHEWVKNREFERRLGDLTGHLAEGWFKLLEWTLVIATLKYLAIKTEAAAFYWLVAISAGAMIEYLRAVLVFRLDFQIWERPLSRRQGFAESFIGLVLGTATMGVCLFIAFYLSQIVADASPL